MVYANPEAKDLGRGHVSVILMMKRTLHPGLIRMQRKHLSIIVICLLSCLLQAQKPDPPEWKEYTFPADNFAVTAPFSPQTYPDSQKEGVRIYHWDLGPRMILTLRAGLSTTCHDTLKKFREAIAKDPRQTDVPGSLKDVSKNGLEGLEYESHYPGGWGADRVYCSKDRGYALSLGYPANQPRPKNAERIFNSFRLLNNPQ